MSVSLLKMLKLKKKTIADYKQPESNAPHIGVEIECMTPAVNPFTKRDLDYLGSFVNIGTDCTINPLDGWIGRELRVLTLQTKFEERVRGVCRILRRTKTRVTSTCGLHVHLDMRPYTPQEHAIFFERLVKAQNDLYKHVKPYRKNHPYCLPNKFHTLDDYCNYASGRSGIHFSRKHHTIEVRIHHGTINPRRICTWIRMLLKIMHGGVLPSIVKQRRTPLLQPKELVNA